MNNALLFLIEVVFSLATFFFIARFLLQAARADFYNPISQAIVKITDPVLKPLRLVLRGFRNIDFASFVAAWLAQLLLLVLLYQLGGQSTGPWGWVIGLTLLKTVLFLLTFLRWSILAMIVISFINPGSYHPAIALLNQICEPVLAPVRRMLPSMGGLDFSPLIVLVGIYMFELIITDLWSKIPGMLG